MNAKFTRHARVTRHGCYETKCKQRKMAEADRTPLIAVGGNLRQRSRKSRRQEDQERRYDADWNPDLPYGGKVFLARTKKPDPWWIICLEV